MKYSIIGEFKTHEKDEIINTINNYNLWRLVAEIEGDYFKIEVWVDTIDEKNSLFSDLKTFVDEYSGLINWHECTHDEQEILPCEIVDEYMVTFNDSN